MRLTVQLKQHTPLIHFQWQQEGATLRASEVKPKLDRFILTRLEGSDYEHRKLKISPLCLVGKGHTPHYALDYKMKIKMEGEPQEYLVASYLNTIGLRNLPSHVKIISSSPYFAQEKENEGIVRITDETKELPKNKQKREFVEEKWEEISKKGVLWPTVKIEFFSLNEEIIKYIREYIVDFFICTNFGTRSNKGFGSFTVSKIEDKNINELANNEVILSKQFDFVYYKTISNINNHPDNLIPTILNIIKTDYQKLKAGVNFKEDYQKSILFCYAVEKMLGHPRWEKRFFKQTLSPSSSKNKPLGKDKLKYTRDPIADASGEKNWKKYNCQFIRVVLGLAEQYEFLLKNKYSVKAKVKVKSEEIERFPSPLMFKVIGNKIYLVGNQVNPRILNKTFTFTYFKNKDKLKNDQKGDLKNTLLTPRAFDLRDFMNYAMDKEQKHGVNLEYKKIKNGK